MCCVQSKIRCVISKAAEITFVSDSVVNLPSLHPPLRIIQPPHPTPHPTCPPDPPLHPAPLPRASLSILFAKGSDHAISVWSCRLCFVGGH